VARYLNEKKIKALKYLAEDPVINNFILNDINFLEYDKTPIWEIYDKSGKIEGVIFKYGDIFIPYFKDNSLNTDKILKIINRYKSKNQNIFGKEEIMKKIEAHLEFKGFKLIYFCVLKSKDRLDAVKEHVKIARPNDGEKIYNTLLRITEFQNTIPKVDEIKERLEDGTSRIFFLEKDNKVVSLAQSTSESPTSAKIIGVATLNGYRGKGYASQCMSELAKNLLDEGKIPRLFYHNLKAGRIYHRLGFKTIGKWKRLYRV